MIGGRGQIYIFALRLASYQYVLSYISLVGGGGGGTHGNNTFRMNLWFDFWHSLDLKKILKSKRL